MAFCRGTITYGLCIIYICCLPPYYNVYGCLYVNVSFFFLFFFSFFFRGISILLYMYSTVQHGAVFVIYGFDGMRIPVPYFISGFALEYAQQSCRAWKIPSDVSYDTSLRMHARHRIQCHYCLGTHARKRSQVNAARADHTLIQQPPFFFPPFFLFHSLLLIHSGESPARKNTR
ncbi:hypothetical protein L873DRAFT_322488 [Choiromyces venosus 120613-1]|uniref:Uncharacterized protein n=1 Tax=Choiromyces venosus 120613-1 TaxID=1336337 RepID=A0A3N4JWX8_9PEZI|nr:hypothetical protein L873DRAFT_322488 [Choiromyces venosus 120613-1]